jgi:pyrroline-5-carboxylate reductase
MSKQLTIGFIGAGNMASSLIAGLRADGYSPDHIWASDPDSEKLQHLQSHFGVRISSDNHEVVRQSQIVVLAVKPQVLREVAEDLNATVQRQSPLVISLAAGVTEGAIDQWLGGGVDIVRCMPNTPALVKTSATAMHGNDRISKEQRSRAEAVLRAVGLVVWVDNEELLDAVTALSGSGPAYFFLFMEAMEEAAIHLGLDSKVARLLAQQTALGSARLAIESDEAPAELRRRVTSPGGTTERAITTFEEAKLREIVLDAMSAAHRRSQELSKEIGGEC